MADLIDRKERNRRNTLTYGQQMAEAQASCAPCKLCGGKAVISDAGPGYGYNINCENWMQRKNECFQGGTRISGWAYNVADRWNELNAIAALPAQGVRVTEDIDALAYRFWSIHPKDIPEPVGMPEGYKGGKRAWFYANEMRAILAAFRENK